MAKEVFIRSKPHVNVASLHHLGQAGFTSLGAWQIASGQIVTDPDDRALAAAIVEEVARQQAGRRTWGPMYFTIRSGR